MILSNGELYESSMQDEILAGLEEKINQIRKQPTLDINKVIAALERIAGRIEGGEFDLLIEGIGFENAEMYKKQALNFLKEENLRYRISTEISELRDDNPNLISVRVPLGTIFHIAAGNFDVLPAYSLMEGLLCGNINIMKLPEADNGITVMLLSMLVDEEPEVKGYIHVFDTLSTDVSAIEKMAAISDAVSVWGGDAVIKAVRKMAEPGTRIIEWGHRLSFCYISVDSFEDEWFKEKVAGLAKHIAFTKQLLCSSCQVIYLDTESMEDVDKFADIFLPVLEAETSKNMKIDMGIRAERTLKKCCKEIENVLADIETSDENSVQNADKRDLLISDNCSITKCADSELELSDMYGNVLIKRLQREKMMDVLRGKKGYLQTAGLIAKENVQEITELLVQCGVNRVMTPEEMSESFLGESHDGIYPFQRYTRIVNISKKII